MEFREVVGCCKRKKKRLLQKEEQKRLLQKNKKKQKMLLQKKKRKKVVAKKGCCSSGIPLVISAQKVGSMMIYAKRQIQPLETQVRAAHEIYKMQETIEKQTNKHNLYQLSFIGINQNQSASIRVIL